LFGKYTLQPGVIAELTLCSLMEDYDLRSCFLPDLSGLHLRIFQFNRLLHQHVPKVALHLDSLGVEGAYLSQWFLSFFAVTCPLPLLFRIYDVIFAEGASETLMRVALAVMHRNEKKILGFSEFEEVMQLLLSRALWDPYGLSATSADDMVSDFVGFTSVVNRESLQALESEFKGAQGGDSGAKGNALFEVQAAASRFLGRMFTSSHSHTASKPNVLSTGLAAPSRRGSTLLRTPSKQSLATLNSIEGGSDGTLSTSSTALTELTDVSRGSSEDSMSLKSMKESLSSSHRTTMHNKDKDLHGQIEDLLTALSEMQREHALLAAQLAKEREERTEDHQIVRSLMAGLQENIVRDPPKEPAQRAVSEYIAPAPIQLPNSIMAMVDKVQTRLASHNRLSSGYETKAQLRAEIMTMKDQLHGEMTRSQDLTRQLSEKEQDCSSLRDDLARARTRIKDGHVEKQRLEKIVQELRQSSRQTSILSTKQTSSPERSGSQNSPSDNYNSPSRSDTGQSEVSVKSGLREFRLLRTQSKEPEPYQTPVFAKRTSSLNTQALLSTENHAPPTDESLLLELVNAKTAEAVAKQELEEFKARFESMRKMTNISIPKDVSADTIISRVSTRSSEKTGMPTTAPSSARSTDSSKTSTPASGSWGGAAGGFFGWGKK
jgi:hypothetical protein